MNQLIRIEDPIESQGYLSNPGVVDAFYRLYEKVNETSKETTKTYDGNLQIEADDIHELHEKIIQSISEFSPKTINIKIVLEQIEGESHVFNDYESFAKHNTTSPYATQEIYLQYQFIILDKGMEKYETYKINLRLSSRLAALEQLKKSAPDIFYEIYATMPANLAGISIEYTNYVKARVFLATFEEWVKGCREAKINPIIATIKRNLNGLSFLLRLSILLLLGYFFIHSISMERLDSLMSVKLTVFYITVFYCMNLTANASINQIKKYFNGYVYLSFIRLNKGDGKLISDFKYEKEKGLRKVIINTVFTFCIGISTSFIYDVMKIVFK